MKTKEELAEYRLMKAKRCLRNEELSFENNFFDESISSCYYAIFHAARALLAINNLSAKSHSGVISLFSLHFIKTGRIKDEFSKILSEAFNKRNESDYLDFFYANEKDAREQMVKANAFITEAARIINQ